MDEKLSTITIERYRTPDGTPTCCADHRIGKTCRFLGVAGFGTRDVCMLGEQHTIYRVLGFTRPDERCEVWADVPHV